MKKTTVMIVLALAFAAALLMLTSCNPHSNLTEGEVVKIVEKGTQEGKSYKIRKRDNGRYDLQEF